MRGVIRLLVTALAITGFALGAGLLLTLGLGGHSDDGDGGVGPRTSTPTSAPPLADVDTTRLAVRRQAFCSSVPASLVAEALGGSATSSASYDDEQRGAVSARVTDIAHEYDCSWSTATRTARAWVFAPPVTPDQAEGLVAATRAAPGCRRLAGAAAYGSPTVAVRCPRLDAGSARTAGTQTVSFRGLFGDAWLACSLSGPRDDDQLADEAGRWCGTVARAAAGSTTPTG